MKIDIFKLRDNPVVYEVDLSPEYLAECSPDNVRFGPGRGSVVLRMIGDDIMAEGAIRGEAIAPCARCLGEARVALEANVHLYYWPKDEETGSKIATFEPGEPDYGVYEGDTLDPDEDLRELLLVETPAVILCRDDCKGLCPTCGANLNEKPCDCAQPDAQAAPVDPAEPAWKRKLRSLRAPSDA
jgi:uncharacterized protein